MSILELQQSVKAVKHAVHITERQLNEERDAVQQDRFGRRPSEMPKALRELFQTGEWREHSVYLWPSVLELSKVGHKLSAQADAEPLHISYKPKTPMSEGSAIADAAVSEALSTATRIAPRLRKILAARNAARYSRVRELSRIYMHKRRYWVSLLDEAEESRSPEAAEQARQRDRELLVATRATSGMGGGMTTREIDLIFSEIEAAGGTAGGLERWGRSITGIPDQNPDYLPPASDGGGVLLANPLTEHYTARNVNPWTRAERLLFLEKFVAHGKNFRKVSTFFEHKSNEDCVRFYFDNKMRLGLKQLLKDSHLRKRGAKKLALVELSKLPTESRSIKDNFIHLPGFFSPDDQEEQEKENARAEGLSTGALGRSWTPQNRQALIFALCRFDVSKEGDEKHVSTVWASIAAIVGDKTPRQCRQFYSQYKTTLALDRYIPPKSQRQSPNRIVHDATRSPEDATPRKLLRRSNSVVKNNGTAVPTTVGEYCVNGGSTAGRIV